MPWTTKDKLNYLLGLPWTIQPAREDDEIVLRVKELPSVIATGRTEAEVTADFWESLTATLESYLHFGDPLPLPTEVTTLPWDRERSSGQVAVAILEGEHGAAQVEVLPPTGAQSGFPQTLRVPVPA